MRPVFFVSHAYKDDVAVQRLLKSSLPHAAQPRLFPAITPQPTWRVSDNIMADIKSCDGLVYIRSKCSFESFWVPFERNYALRLSKVVFAFDPVTGTFEQDKSAAIGPVLAINLNLCIYRDSLMTAGIALDLFNDHRFEIRGKNYGLIDSDVRQMLDSLDGLHQKVKSGAVVVLFLSNDSICCGFQDYCDPYEDRRARKDCGTPMGHTGSKFALFQSDRTLVVWLDSPDHRRIETQLERYHAPHWVPYVERIRAALAEESKCVIVGSALNDIESCGFGPGLKAQEAYYRIRPAMNQNAIDNIMVRAFYLAYTAIPDFRMRLAGSNISGLSPSPPSSSKSPMI